MRTSFLENCEQHWAERARGGDRAAFDRLRHSLEPDIQRFVRRLIGTSHSADDVIQDAFLSLFMNIHRIEPLSNLRPFLYRIVRNRCYDELRWKGRFTTVPLEDLGDGGPAAKGIADPSPTPDDAVMRLLMMADVERAIDTLPELQRETMILFAEEGLSLVEVAEAMGTEVGTVKSRLHHARRNTLRRIPPGTRAALGIGKDDDNGK